MDKRTCFYIDPTQTPDEDGYIPSLVTEGEPGHAPLTGGGDFQTPWYWGKTLAEAEATAAKANAEQGLSPRDVIDIVMSSMVARR